MFTVPGKHRKSGKLLTYVLSFIAVILIVILCVFLLIWRRKRGREDRTVAAEVETPRIQPELSVSRSIHAGMPCPIANMSPSISLLV